MVFTFASPFLRALCRVLGQIFGVWHSRNTWPPARSTGLCPVLWVGGLLFDARHRKSDLARQSARRKGEAKVGKGGKGEFLNGELILDMLSSS